jgi:hypothetical protein
MPYQLQDQQYQGFDEGLNDEPSGGRLAVGDFGSSNMQLHPGEMTTLQYVQKINPNFAIGGVLAVLGIGVMSFLVGSLGTANPNAQLLAAQTTQAESNKALMQAQSEALKAVANQRPACIALFCSTSEAPDAQAYQAPTYQQPPDVAQYQSPQYQSPQPPDVDRAQPQPYQEAISPPAEPVQSPWVEWVKDPVFRQQWVDYCSPNWDIEARCQELRASGALDFQPNQGGGSFSRQNSAQ